MDAQSFCVCPQIKASDHIHPRVANDAHLPVLSFPMFTSKTENVFPWWSFSFCLQVLGQSQSGSYLDNKWSSKAKNPFVVQGWKQSVHCHRQWRHLRKQDPGRNVDGRARLSGTENVLLCVWVFFWKEGLPFQKECLETLTNFNGKFLS